jgi:hypothetical protein
MAPLHTAAGTTRTRPSRFRAKSLTVAIDKTIEEQLAEYTETQAIHRANSAMGSNVIAFVVATIR